MRSLAEFIFIGALAAAAFAASPAAVAQEGSRKATTSTSVRAKDVGLATYINPEALYEPSKHGFSQAVVSPPGARLVYVAGQMGIDSEGNVPAKDFEGQVRTAFQNLRLALEGAGSSLDHVLEVRLLSVDHTSEKEKIIAAVTNEAFPGPNKPASMLIPVPRLALDGLLFEIGAVGYVPANASQ